jgi:DNA-binding PadR family transcriptional regulator
LPAGRQTSTNGILADEKSNFGEFLHGTLGLLVLKAIEHRPRNGANIRKWIAEHSGGSLKIGPGSLYPALHKLQAKRLIKAPERGPEAIPWAKTYTITPEGRMQLVRKSQDWRKFSSTIKHIVGDEETRRTARLTLILMMALRHDWHLQRGPNNLERR